MRVPSGFRPLPVAVSLLLIAVAHEDLWAQAQSSASITGRVVDDSGGPMPGTTVTVTSPVLQVPSVTTTTDNQGNYRVVDLPAPGVYIAATTCSPSTRPAFSGHTLQFSGRAKKPPVRPVRVRHR